MNNDTKLTARRIGLIVGLLAVLAVLGWMSGRKAARGDEGPWADGLQQGVALAAMVALGVRGWRK